MLSHRNLKNVFKDRIPDPNNNYRAEIIDFYLNNNVSLIISLFLMFLLIRFKVYFQNWYQRWWNRTAVKLIYLTPRTLFTAVYWFFLILILAVLIPLAKNRNREDYQDMRSTSLLPALSKFLEVLDNQFKNYVYSNKLYLCISFDFAEMSAVPLVCRCYGWSSCRMWR